MEKQDWQGKELDKDLLVYGNKKYSAETCLFVPAEINKFIRNHSNSSRCLPAGVYFQSSSNRYQAQCSNPITNRLDSVGYFDDCNEAHKAWLMYKREIAIRLSKIQKDKLIADLIVRRFDLLCSGL